MAVSVQPLCRGGLCEPRTPPLSGEADRKGLVCRTLSAITMASLQQGELPTLFLPKVIDSVDNGFQCPCPH